MINAWTVAVSMVTTVLRACRVCCLRETDIYPWQDEHFLFMPRPYKHIKQNLPLLGLCAVGHQGDIRESSERLFKYFLGKKRGGEVETGSLRTCSYLVRDVCEWECNEIHRWGHSGKPSGGDVSQLCTTVPVHKTILCNTQKRWNFFENCTVILILIYQRSSRLCGRFPAGLTFRHKRPHTLTFTHFRTI